MKNKILVAFLVLSITGCMHAQTTNVNSIGTLSAAELQSRAETYSGNRQFPEARQYWQALIDNYPEDPLVPKALFGVARSYMWERQYLTAVEWFDRLVKDHSGTKEGREGLAFKGASYVRAGKDLEAAQTYQQYVTMFPDGERIDSAYLNIIDAYREAGKYNDANDWAAKAVDRFAGTPTEANAVHARLRMEIFRKNWQAAVSAADELLALGSLRGSMTSTDEAKYLKAFALEKSGKKADASRVFASITNGSFYGDLAEQRANKGGVKPTAQTRTASLYTSYPIKFEFDILKNAKKHNIDPRFLLAIMKQESAFRSSARSPAGARGLLQLVYDTAIKYKDEAGYANLQPDDLYASSVNVAIGSIYISKLKDEFDGMYEAIAASYNAGEDNAARWLVRTSPHDAGIFASEVGFSETKNYVFKVMNNYRMYKLLYDENLNRR
jgi:soluble lytic murein transglycosylase